MIHQKKTAPVIGVLAFLLFIIVFVSCKKDVQNNPNVPTGETPDLSSKVNSSVSGFVTDENNAAVQGATVLFGTRTSSTDEHGFFEIKNENVVKTAAVVTVTKTGYFKGIKTYGANAGKAAFFRIKLLPKTIAGTINASSGGEVSFNGVHVALPANGVVVATSGAAYTGNINVAASWINPEATDLTEIMPGDLRGLDNDGFLKGLTTYGMVAVELTGDAGQLLQVAGGKKATITMPLSGSLSAAAPASIPLWYFDESNGLWKQDGSATKTGNAYVGDVSHFSYWNCDLPNAIVPLTFTVVDGTGNPVANAHIEIRPTTSNSWSHIGGWTDATGYVSVFVTPNTSYSLEVYGSCSNGSTPAYSQSFSVITDPVNLGNIVIPTATTATGSGIITDCNGDPVTNGYLFIQDGNYFTSYPTDNNGAYNFSKIICNGSTPVNLIAEDLNSSQQNTPVPFTLVTGPNATGNLQACGISTNTFINCMVDGVMTNFAPPADSLIHTSNGTTTTAWIDGSGGTSPNNRWIAIAFDVAGIGVGTTQNLTDFTTSAIPVFQPTIVNPIGVTITEYGPVGGFIAGNFSGVVNGPWPTNEPYQVVCSFRVRRSF